jgi:hypothetical protein
VPHLLCSGDRCFHRCNGIGLHLNRQLRILRQTGCLLFSYWIQKHGVENTTSTASISDSPQRGVTPLKESHPVSLRKKSKLNA